MAISSKNHVVRNVLLLVGGIIAALILSQLELFNLFLDNVKEVTFLDAFVGGLLFVFTFTVPVGALVLISASDHLPIILVAVIGSLGAGLGDFLIYRFVRDNLLADVEPLCDGYPHGYFKRIFCSPYFRWTLPVLGAIIVASPLPDEFGVSLMGLSQISTKKFFMITIILNMIGILALIGGVNIFR